MKCVLILFLTISSCLSLHAYELRLHFSRAYIYNDILYTDVKTAYNDEVYQKYKKDI
ncbi:hypothetical protein [Brachyspira sp. G79]|uniref:hypothetical protein n=1 Tax=Brachyspira sp. G79 TaxID=1358104 RepID=UPI001F0AC622|nr:hypothetical protein [Brachyspira sp. G79]